MRYGASVLLLAALAATGCQPASTELTESEREAITTKVNEVVTGLFDAMNAHDAERLLGHYVDDGDFAYVAALSVRPGLEGFSAMVRAYYPERTDLTFTHRILYTQVLSPTAAVVFTEGASSEIDHLVWTHVLVRVEDGSWRIAYEHEAWPGAEPPSRHPGM
jgi:uncharacterized protein (TIGR02246 family)